MQWLRLAVGLCQMGGVVCLWTPGIYPGHVGQMLPVPVGHEESFKKETVQPQCGNRFCCRGDDWPVGWS